MELTSDAKLKRYNRAYLLGGDEYATIVSTYCDKVRSQQPSRHTTIQRHAIENSTITVIVKEIRDTRTQERSYISILNMWDTMYTTRLKQARHALEQQFVTVYDMFTTNGNLYIIMEAMTGDGMDFRKQYHDDEHYLKHVDTCWHVLFSGLVHGLFNNNLYFSDIKPQNIAYTLNDDSSCTFKWIDVECISRITSGCYQVDYLDLYNIDFETTDQLSGDSLFYTDLWKVGLSILTMLNGQNPITELLSLHCTTCGDLADFMYINRNLTAFKDNVEQARQQALTNVHIPLRLRNKIRYFLDPIGSNRLRGM